MSSPLTWGEIAALDFAAPVWLEDFNKEEVIQASFIWTDEDEQYAKFRRWAGDQLVSIRAYRHDLGERWRAWSAQPSQDDRANARWRERKPGWIEVSPCEYKCQYCGFTFTSADPIEMFKYCRCGRPMFSEGIPAENQIVWFDAKTTSPASSGRFMVTIKNRMKPHVETANYDKVSDRWDCSGVVSWSQRPKPYYVPQYNSNTNR